MIGDLHNGIAEDFRAESVPEIKRRLCLHVHPDSSSVMATICMRDYAHDGNHSSSSGGYPVGTVPPIQWSAREGESHVAE